MEKVKLTKTAINKFIKWTTTRYNDWLGYGTKKQNVELIYNQMLNPTKDTFTVQCASPVGENPYHHSGTPKYWRTKTGGDIYHVDTVNKTIKAQYSKREIQFI